MAPVTNRHGYDLPPKPPKRDLFPLAAWVLIVVTVLFFGYQIIAAAQRGWLDMP